ncbi:MAG: extracellular solute-binding protein, partial [Firmicutes bacterium]|nr:extracellular solute-binding protein [Bacillota bacterium]
MKKLITLLLAAVMMFSFFGCGGGGDDKDKVDKDDTIQTSQYAGTEITFKHFWVDVHSYLKNLAEMYSTQSGLKINVELAPVTTYLTSINTNIQTDNVPEIFTMWPGASILPYADSGVLSDFNEIDMPFKARMYDFARNACTTGGSLYLAPVNNAFMGIAYNKAVFERNNV